MITQFNKYTKSLQSRRPTGDACKTSSAIKTRIQKPRPTRQAEPPLNAWEHLAIHRLVQSSAHDLWVKKGEPADAALEIWVEAKRAVIAEFIRLRQNPPE